MSLRWLAVALLTLLQLSCAHRLRECAQCGPGKVCQRMEIPGATIDAFQCYTSCKSDRDCGSGQTCNCDSEDCSHQSTVVPSNVCVAGEQRRPDEFENRFVIDSHDRRFCKGCQTGETCVDISRTEESDYRCTRQCANDTECPAGLFCNCADEQCTGRSASLPANVCVGPQAQWQTTP